MFKLGKAHICFMHIRIISKGVVSDCKPNFLLIVFLLFLWVCELFIIIFVYISILIFMIPLLAPLFAIASLIIVRPTSAHIEFIFLIKRHSPSFITTEVMRLPLSLWSLSILTISVFTMISASSFLVRCWPGPLSPFSSVLWVLLIPIFIVLLIMPHLLIWNNIIIYYHYWRSSFK